MLLYWRMSSVKAGYAFCPLLRRTCRHALTHAYTSTRLCMHKHTQTQTNTHIRDMQVAIGLESGATPGTIELVTDAQTHSVLRPSLSLGASTTQPPTPSRLARMTQKLMPFLKVLEVSLCAYVCVLFCCVYARGCALSPVWHAWPRSRCLSQDYCFFVCVCVLFMCVCVSVCV